MEHHVPMVPHSNDLGKIASTLYTLQFDKKHFCSNASEISSLFKETKLISFVNYKLLKNSYKVDPKNYIFYPKITKQLHSLLIQQFPAFQFWYLKFYLTLFPNTKISTNPFSVCK